MRPSFKVVFAKKNTCGSHEQCMRPTNTFFSKKNFKIGSHDTIHTFKNYFVTMFLVFSNKRYLNRALVVYSAKLYTEQKSLFLSPNIMKTSKII